MNEVDAYIYNLPSLNKREALLRLRIQIHEILPDAIECISYGMPAFRVDGECVAGFAAFKNHLTFFPFSGSITREFKDELVDFTFTK